MHVIYFLLILFDVFFNKGVSPMGIFWSMVQAPGQRPGLKLVKKDLDTPLTTSISIYAGHLPIQSIHSSHDLGPICLGSIERWYKARTVKKQIVRDGRIRGVLYLPTGNVRLIK